MKKIISTLFLVLIISCNSNNELQGTWIGAYSYPDGYESAFFSPVLNLVTFQNDSIFTKGFRYGYPPEKKFNKGTYIYKENIIIDGSDSERRDTIYLINNDSLVIKGAYGSNNTVYKKLEDSLKSKSKDIKLVGKRFLVKSKNNKDTLNFINDSIVVFSSDSSRNQGTLWERVNHNGFDILFMELNTPVVIRGERNGKIVLTGFHKIRHDYELIEIK